MAAGTPPSILGATAEEVAVIKSALNLLCTRAAEKHTSNPNMGWGAQARIASELGIRMG